MIMYHELRKVMNSSLYIQSPKEKEKKKDLHLIFLEIFQSITQMWGLLFEIIHVNSYVSSSSSQPDLLGLWGHLSKENAYEKPKDGNKEEDTLINWTL